MTPMDLGLPEIDLAHMMVVVDLFESLIDLQHKLLTAVTDNRPLVELIREAKAEVTVEEKDIDEADIVVNSI